MTSRTLTAILLAPMMLLSHGPPGRAQQLFEDEMLTEQPSEIEFISERIDEVEREIAEKISRLRRAEKVERAGIEASRNLRIIARDLLKTARSNPQRGAVAGLYGHTIANHLEAFDERMNRVTDMARAAMDGNGEDPPPVQRLLRIGEALKKFNERQRQTGELRAVESRPLDDRLKQLLQPLAKLAVALGEPEPVDAWPDGEALRGRSEPTAGESVDLERLRQLRSRIEPAPLDDESQAELLNVAEMLVNGWRQPDLRPKVEQFYRRVDQALGVAKAFDEAKWLAPATAEQFREALHTAVLLFKDPRTRESGMERLDYLVQLRPIVERMNELAGMQFSAEHLQSLFAVALNAHEPGRNLGEFDPLLQLLAEITAVLTDVRQFARAELPVDIRRSLNLLKREYDTLEQSLLADLGELRRQPQAASRPEWTQRVDTLEERVAWMERLNRVPQWLGRISARNRAASRGVYGQLRKLAEELLDPATREGAGGALAEFEKQIGLLGELPLEPELPDADSRLGRMLGQTRAPLLEQIASLRGQWATAWADGEDPTLAGEKLLQVRRLLELVQRTRDIAVNAAEIERLNRWAAWETSADVGRLVADLLPRHLRAAAENAAAGDFVALNARLNLLEGELPLPRLLQRLNAATADALEKLPGGVSGMLGQCIHGPESGDLGTYQRFGLARLSCLLSEAGFARLEDRPRAAESLLLQCGDLAKQILADLDAPPEQQARSSTSEPTTTEPRQSRPAGRRTPRLRLFDDPMLREDG